MSLLTRSRHPSYHLRPNKAIDRLLFLETIRALDTYCTLDRHIYVGFAGPFLEDARMISQTYPNLEQISIEEDEETHKRQEFHRCSRNLTLLRTTFKDFLTTSYPSAPTVIWPDYTDLTRDVLLEVSDIARKALALTLMRVTARAETPVYVELGLRPRTEHLPESRREDFKRFAEEFEKAFTVPDVAYDSSLFTFDNFLLKRFPGLLVRLINSVIQGSCVAPKEFVPLQSSMYSDGTIMTSLTGIFVDAGARSEVEQHFREEGVLATHPLVPEPIDVPILTTKERLHLESLLPIANPDGKKCIRRLGYLVEEDEGTSAYKLRQYEKYHRFYPFFGKLVP